MMSMHVYHHCHDVQKVDGQSLSPGGRVALRCQRSDHVSDAKVGGQLVDGLILTPDRASIGRVVSY